MTKQPTLFDLGGQRPVPPAPPDQAARDFAVDPRHDVVLEASAGTGKTRVLVDRYLRLLEAGVDPRNILAITFTRKAAAEMRDRALTELARRASAGLMAPARGRELSERVADIQILTIDAFCFALLREFPLEAGVDPGFAIADETEMGRFANEALDLTFRALRGVLVEDEAVRLLLARVRLPVLRAALSGLIDRRHIALPAVGSFVRRQGPARSAVEIAGAFRERVHQLVATSPHGRALLEDGPPQAPEFRWLAADLDGSHSGAADPASASQLRRRLEQYFLTKGKPRQQLPRSLGAARFASAAARSRHQDAVRALAPGVLAAIEALDRDLDGLLSRGLQRVLTIAAGKYEELLDEYAVLDFAALLDRTVALLERQEEFARSRLKLQSRYQHLLVDEFQDTSRRQWRLIELLIDAWGEGEGAADAPTSIFVVGDRKQSIYRFRHAEVTLLDEAARRIGALRAGGRPVRHAIRTSFRAVPELLAFVNALAGSLESQSELPERFSYGEADRFPVPPVAPGGRRDGQAVLGIVAEATLADCARAVADEIHALLGRTVVRDATGAPRPAAPDDIAILFRARAGHQFFEEALEERGVRTYVYKGLGFFDAPEVQDLQALIRFLARPESDLCAAEFLRSRFVRLSDAALVQLAPAFARVLREPNGRPAGLAPPDAELLSVASGAVGRWLSLANWIPPGELVDLVLRESAYAFELGGRRLAQAVENVKKVRALVGRVESRGYATLGRLAAYFDTLRAGEESNAILDASGAVSLMTIHAAKGLEFPIVFVVNLHAPGRGRPAGFSVVEQGPGGEPEVAFGSTPATELEQQREDEELRRLFYVAVTRARDRLYLAAEVDLKGQVKRGARSLASLLSADLGETFAAARVAPADAEVEWQSPQGAFAFRVCHPTDQPVAQAIPSAAATQSTAPPRVAPLAPSGRLVVPVASLTEPVASRLSSSGALRHPRRNAPSSLDDRLVGTVVHRLFQRRADPSEAEEVLAETAARLVPGDQGMAADDQRALARSAATLYRRFAARPDVVALLGAGECHYEVPFFHDPPDRPGERVRGLIDCLVIQPDGGATVVEFKTGRPRPEHHSQAAWYARAVEAALDTGPVEVRILYP